MAEILYTASLLSLIYVYIGYYLSLIAVDYMASFFRTQTAGQEAEGYSPSVSVVVAAYNEEKSIAERIENLLSLSYSGEIEIIIASDGSDDRTVEIASRYAHQNVKVLEFKENSGRASVHNQSIPEARGEIIITTDAETEFEKDFLQKIVMPFQEESVGGSVGYLSFKGTDSAIGNAESVYWGQEVKIRLLQDRLGFLMTGSGACTAFRKNLFRPLRGIDDVDFATMLDIIKAGKKIRYTLSAKAYDHAPSTFSQELSGRIRSSKRLSGTLTRWSLKDWAAHPFYAWTFISHKLLRWLSPLLLICLFFSNALLLGDLFFNVSFCVMVIAAILAILGAVGHAHKKAIPVASTAFGFAIANWGFFLGFIRLIRGQVVTKYKMPEA